MSINPYESPHDPRGYAPVPEHSEQPESLGAIAYGVVVRSFGLFFFCYGIWNLGFMLGYAVGMPETYIGECQAVFFSGITLAVVGILLIRMTKYIVAMSYRK